jgi:hypothetical protein
MSAASHGDGQILLARECHRGDNVAHAGRSNDEGGTDVGARLPHHSAGVILAVIRPDNVALNEINERLDGELVS